ncbi:hypothetical protein [Paenibacillus hemerocallicola]|nr:hypothetical protein [Paenibacillus hemerocallicola]
MLFRLQELAATTARRDFNAIKKIAFQANEQILDRLEAHLQKMSD